MGANQDLILAIDNGTQSVRALIFDLDGALVAKIIHTNVAWIKTPSHNAERFG